MPTEIITQTTQKRMTDERLAEYSAWFADPNGVPEGFSRHELLQALKAEREQVQKEFDIATGYHRKWIKSNERIEQLEEDFRHMTDFRDHWKCKSQILEAERKEIEECQRYTILAAILADGEPGITVTTDNPDGEWIEAKDLQAILNKGEG